MTKKWFESKVRYDKTLDTGLIKTVTEVVLLDAMSYTEAEAITIREMKPYISGSFTITDIKQKKYSEVFLNHKSDLFYRARLQYITLDEKSGAEKKQSVNMLVEAENLEGAFNRVKEEMSRTMIDYSIHTITETPIVFAILYAEDK